MVVGANVVGAAVGARHEEREDLGAPMTARLSSTAKGKARFFEVLGGAEATSAFVGPWTIVDVLDIIILGAGR